MLELLDFLKPTLKSWKYEVLIWKNYHQKCKSVFRNGSKAVSTEGIVTTVLDCGYTDMREQSMDIGPNGAGDPHY